MAIPHIQNTPDNIVSVQQHDLFALVQISRKTSKSEGKIRILATDNAAFG